LLVGGCALYRDAQSELDPVKRAALFIRMNDIGIAGRPNGHVPMFADVLLTGSRSTCACVAP